MGDCPPVRSMASCTVQPTDSSGMEPEKVALKANYSAVDCSTLVVERQQEVQGCKNAVVNQEITHLRQKLSSAERELAAFRTVCQLDNASGKLQNGEAELEVFREDVHGRLREEQTHCSCRAGMQGQGSQRVSMGAAAGEKLEQACKTTLAVEGDRSRARSPFSFLSWRSAQWPEAQNSEEPAHPQDKDTEEFGLRSPASLSPDSSLDCRPSLVRVTSRLDDGEASFPPAGGRKHGGMDPEELVELVQRENLRLSLELAAAKAELEAATCTSCQLDTQGGRAGRGSGAASIGSDLPLGALLEASREEVDRAGEHLMQWSTQEQPGADMEQALELRDLMETLRDVRECVLLQVECLRGACEKTRMERERQEQTLHAPAHLNVGEFNEMIVEKEVDLEEFTAEEVEAKNEPQRMLTAEEVVAEQAQEMAALKDHVRWLQLRLDAEQRIIDGHVASMAEMREEVEAVKEERDSKLAALKASVLEILKLKDQVEQLREAESLLGDKLRESMGEARQLRADLLEAKGAALSAQEDLEATKRRSEDIRASVVQLMDRMTLQQSDIDKGKEECEQALVETEKVLAELGQRDLLIENLMKTQLELEQHLESTSTELTQVVMQKEELQKHLRAQTERWENTEKELRREKEALESAKEARSSVAALAAQGGPDLEAGEELRKEKEWSASLQERCNSLERQCQALRVELESTRAKAADEKAALSDEGRVDSLAARLQETEKSLWRARLEEEKAKEEVESLKSSCIKLDAELSAKSTELEKLRPWRRQISADGPVGAGIVALHRPSLSFVDHDSRSALSTPSAAPPSHAGIPGVESILNGTPVKESAEAEDFESQLEEALCLAARIQEESVALQRQLERAEKEAEDRVQQIAATVQLEREAEGKVEALEAEMAVVRGKLEDALQGKRELEHRVLKLEQDANVLEEKLNVAELQTAAARDSLASLGVTHAEAMEATRKERDEGKIKMSELMAEHGSLQQENGQLQRESANLGSRLSLLEKELSCCKEALEAQEASHGEKEKARQAAEERVKGAASKIRELEEALQQFASLEGSVSRSTAMAAQLQQALSQKQAEHDETKVELMDSRRTLAELSAADAELRASVEKFRSQVDSLKLEPGASESEKVALQCRVTELVEEACRAQASSVKEKEGLCRQVETLEEQLAEMVQDRHLRLSEMEVLEKARSVLEAEVERLTGVTKELQVEKHALEATVGSLESAVQEASGLTGRVVELERKLEGAERERALERESHERELEMLESSLAMTHQQKLTDLEVVLEASRAAAEGALKAKVAELEAQMSSTASCTGAGAQQLGQELERVAVERDELEMDVRGLEREKEALAREKQKLQGKVLELEGAMKSKLEAAAVARHEDHARKLEETQRELGNALAAKEEYKALCRSLQQSGQTQQARLEAARNEAQRGNEDAALARAEFRRAEEELASLVELVTALRGREAVASALLEASRQQVCRAHTLAIARGWRIKALRNRCPSSAGIGQQTTVAVKKEDSLGFAPVSVQGSTEDQLVEVIAALERRVQELSLELVATKEAEKEAQRQILVMARIKEALEGEVRKWREEGTMRRRAEEDSISQLAAIGSTAFGPRTLSSTSLRGSGMSSPAIARAASTTSASAAGEDTLVPSAFGDLLRFAKNMDVLVAPRSKTPERGMQLASTSTSLGLKAPEKRTSKGNLGCAPKTPDRITRQSKSSVSRPRTPEQGSLGPANKRARTPEKKKALKKSATGVARVWNGDKGQRDGTIQAKHSGSFYRVRSTTRSQAPMGPPEFQATTGAFAAMASALGRGPEVHAKNGKDPVPAKDTCSADSSRFGSLRKFKSAKFMFGAS